MNLEGQVNEWTPEQRQLVFPNTQSRVVALHAPEVPRHASIGQTADTCGHVQPERHESAVAGLDRYLTV